MVNENGLVKKLGTTAPYKKSSTSPPIIISYPGAIATKRIPSATVVYHGNKNILKKNKIVVKIRLIITELA